MPASKAQPQKIAAAGNQPDLFELKGGRTRITYQTTSFTGGAEFHYKDGTRDLNFKGTQIDVAQTSLATEVTVTLQLLTDAPGVKFTLVIPEITLGTKTEAAFSTFGVLVTTRGFVVPKARKLQRQTYKVVELSGAAKNVQF
jgi:hypothetical protein